MFHGRDASGASVIIRTFTQPLSAAQRGRFTAALAALCEAPLEHPSIARPLASGLTADDRPFVVHAYLPGTPLSDIAAASDPRSLDDIANRLTYLAGALDFAAATGVLHGALSPADVIFSVDSAGVSGLGLVQALESAGVDGFLARREDDVAALMQIARTLFGRQASPAAQALFSGPVPSSALAFAAALHRTIQAPVEQPSPSERAPAPPVPFSDPDDFAPEPPDAGLIDVQLRHDDERTAAPAMFGVSGPPVDARPRGRSWSWLLIGTVALALGVFTGFAGGLFLGRETPVTPPAVQTPQPKPGPTNGQTYTDTTVDDSTKDVPSPTVTAPPPAPAATPPEQAAEPRSDPAVAPPRQTPAPAPTGPAAIRVDSRPIGAQVFVDGQSVGYTPLVVGELAPGTHSIRMQLPGHRPWVSAVTLGPGARERIAASLEQQ